jgi:diacylglycerol kinase (ATP)
VKRWFGRPGAYSVAFLHALLELRPFEVRVDVDGCAHVGRFFHVCAGNTPRAGGGAMHLSPGARMDDGRLEICLVEGVSRMEVLRCFPRLLRGTFPGHPKVRYFPGRRLTVEAVPSSELSLDGDVVGRTPATFEVLPGALRLRVPPERPQVGLDSTPAVD